MASLPEVMDQIKPVVEPLLCGCDGWDPKGVACADCPHLLAYIDRRLGAQAPGATEQVSFL